MIFNSEEAYKEWINNQDWYQTIELKNGLITPGKFPTHERLKYMEEIDFNNKSVLDIGCNSGQYCMYAKKKGAEKVVGVDINKKRLEQAKVLAKEENLDIDYCEKDLFSLRQLGKFDIVLCIAVLTEIQDIFGAIDVLKEVIGNYCFLELDLAKPLLYVSMSKRWIKGNSIIKRNKSILEYRSTKHGNMISPSFEVLKHAFGGNYKLKERGKGIRYDMVDVQRA